MKGIVTVTKVNTDGTKEVLCQDDNVLTDGLGVGIINIFTDTGSNNVADHIAGYFQVGIGRLNPDTQDPEKKSYISNLEAPLSYSNYGDEPAKVIDNHNLYKLHSGPFIGSISDSVEQSTFVALPDAYSTKIIDGVAHFRLELDETTANGMPISEFGLFSRNPDGKAGSPQSVLLAYKNFPINEQIDKTSDFSLIIDWQIKFVDTVSEDAEYTPANKNVVFIMLDDVGLDYLGFYDSQNPYDLSCPSNANANPFSQLDDPVDGCGIYPHTPCLSGLASSGVLFNNARAQAECTPTRSTVMTGRYNFSCKDSGVGTAPTWGPGLGIVAGGTQVKRRKRGGLAALNKSYSLLPEPGGGEDAVPFEELVVGSDDSENKIAKQKVLAEYMGDISYNSSFFGKWHLATWENQLIYCEDGTGPAVMGENWNHIPDVGKFDYYMATWANLRGAETPTPGRDFSKPHSPWLPDVQGVPGGGWPDYAGSAFYLHGDEMGYVNFFSNENGTPVPVSDTGWVTPAQSSSGTAYSQGDASSFNTTYLFDEAAKYFNSSNQEEPFFMYIAPSLPHDPWTFPPEEGVYNQWLKDNHYQKVMERQIAAGEAPDSGDAVSASWVTVNAQLEHFDYTLSGWLDSLDSERKENTIFIITSDNGSVWRDMRKRATFASGAFGSSGLGEDYERMIYLTEYASGLAVSAMRRGGDNESGYNFKSSCYDRGTLVPFIVYGGDTGLEGSSILSGIETNAFVDIHDILATVVNIGGRPAQWGGVPSDSHSFYNVITGQTDASSHSRQFSYNEAFWPIGNSVGNMRNWGTHSGSALECSRDDALPLKLGNPVLPRKYRRALAVRHTKDDYLTRPGPSLTQTVINDIEDNNSNVNITWQNGSTTYPSQPIPEASAGVWKIMRPSSSGNQMIYIDPDTGEYTVCPDPTEGWYAPIPCAKEINLGKGKWYSELYHLRDIDFDPVDPFEIYDLVPEDIKGKGVNCLVSGLLVSACSAVGDSGHLDNTVHYFNLARILEVALLELSEWTTKRRDPSTSIIGLPNDAFGDT